MGSTHRLFCFYAMGVRPLLDGTVVGGRTVKTIKRLEHSLIIANEACGNY
jgi:hypothetical protein